MNLKRLIKKFNSKSLSVIFNNNNNNIYIYIYNLGNLKAPFSIVTTQRWREGHYSFLWIATLTLDSYLIMMLSEGASSSIFLVFGMTRPGIEHWSPRPLANTLTIMLLSRTIYIYIIPVKNKWYTVQSAGAEEYTDCISAKVRSPPQWVF